MTPGDVLPPLLFPFLSTQSLDHSSPALDATPLAPGPLEANPASLTHGWYQAGVAGCAVRIQMNPHRLHQVLKPSSAHSPLAGYEPFH